MSQDPDKCKVKFFNFMLLRLFNILDKRRTLDNFLTKD